MIQIFVYSFVIFIIAYIVCNHKNIDQTNIAFIAVGVVMLMFNLHRYKLYSLVRKEHFAEEKVLVGETITKTEKLVELMEEDISVFKDIATVYLTIFNNISYNYNGINNRWNNVIPPDPKVCSGDNSTFYLEMLPHFSKTKGLYLGTNKITGPLCNNLGINLQSTFTIFFSCIHGDMGTNNTSSEIEFFKLYGNTNNNNALAFYIERDSLELDDQSNQNAKLLLKWIDETNEIECKVRPQDNKITLRKDVLSLYFIVKQPDMITVYYTFEGNEDPITLGSISIDTTQTSSANFSNKEMMINRFKNYKGSLFQFGIFKNSLSTDEISSIKNHIVTEYRKNTNLEFQRVLELYREMQTKLEQITKCPFNDKAACNDCSTISNWTDINQIINAPSICKQSINSFCAKNKEHTMCRCWDPTYVGYQTDSCKLFRSIFSKNIDEFIKNIDQNSIETIKTTFNLVEKNDCPKTACSNVDMCIPGTKLNKYGKYDYEQLKVSMPTESDVKSFKVDKVYPELPGQDKFPTKIIRMNNDATYQLEKIKGEKDVEIIPNMYKRDVSVNFKDDIYGQSNVTSSARPSTSFYQVLSKVFLPS